MDTAFLPGHDRMALSSAAAIQAQRRALPVYNAGDKIVAHVRDNATTIVVGETGSGKTTRKTYLFVCEYFI